jgi:hypothetical protein
LEFFYFKNKIKKEIKDILLMSNIERYLIIVMNKCCDYYPQWKILTALATSMAAVVCLGTIDFILILGSIIHKMH